MLARGLALRFEKKTPPGLSLGAIDRGLSTIASKLPDAERAGFEADVKRRDLGDARACQLFLLLGSGVQQLDPGERSEFLRALAGELQAAPR
jgi:hypothetical protein